MKKHITLFVLAVFFTLTGSLLAQQIDPMQPLPNDETVRFGILENGMTYYIKSNQEPRNRASFYIIQNVGALLEEDHQNGLAHFLEHMAFNGTRHFPDKGIIDFLERHGVAFGENINAFTSQSETVYTLMDVPVNKPGVIDTSLLVLHDWSNYLLLTEEEIDAERGVIKEEWRTTNTAQRRISKASLPYFFPNSKYAERDIIGDMDIVENFEYDVLRDFYRTWYRTDLQAIAIAGDFDAGEMEQKVIDRFSGITALENAPERPFFEIPENEDLLFGVVTDKEASRTDIYYIIRHKKQDTGHENLMDHREDYIHQLFNRMMGQRINELLQKGDPPFVVGGVSYGDFVRGYEVLFASVTPNPGEEISGLSALLTEMERARRHGFTQGELDRARAEILSQWEKRYNERDKIHNNEFVTDYQNHFLEGEAYLSAETGYQLVQALLPTITLKDFDRLMEQGITDKNRVLLIQGPEGQSLELLARQDAEGVLDQVAIAKIDPYEDAALAESLITEELALSAIANQKNLKILDAVEWTLENGTRVIFRKADYDKDQVQIRGYSRGGSSLYEEAYIPSADMLTSLVSTYGVGEFDATGLQKMLAGKNVSLQLSLGSLTEGLSGTATPKDMETLMQLIYLHFNYPRFDEEAHEAIVARYQAFWENLNKNPQKIMSDSLSLILTDYHPRTRIMDLEFLDDIELSMIEEIYTDRFADASDFFFIIVGNMEEEQVKTLAQKYLGSIKDMEREENWIDRKVYEPEGVVRKTIPVTLETPKADINIFITNEMDYTPYNRMVMRVIENVLDLRYMETIREEESGTYGVGIGTQLSRWPVEKASMQITFDSDPGRAQELKEKVYKELEKLAAEGPSATDLSKTVENILKDREESKEHNAYYLNTLYSYYVHGIDYNDPANYEDIVQRLTPEDVRKVMKEFYTDPNIVDVVFVPKEEEATSTASSE